MMASQRATAAVDSGPVESHVLVAPGLRTAAHPGWRAGVSTAVSAVARQPSLWLLGIVGFCLRGGILVLILPIIVAADAG